MPEKNNSAKIDASNYQELIRQFPHQLNHAATIAQNAQIPKPKKIESLVICGMGGSGIAGQLAMDLVKNELKIPWQSHADYSLPAFANSKTLVIIASYSGTTQETVSAFREAKKRKATVVSITSGGEIGQSDANAILIPGGYPPRQSLAYLFVPVLKILSHYKLISKKGPALLSAIKQLHQTQPKIQQKARLIASKANHQQLVIYPSPFFHHTAYRWTTQQNENAKQISHSHELPEMNHNEINAIPATRHTYFVLLHQKTDSSDLTKRFEFLQNVIGHHRCHDEVYSGLNPLADQLLAIHLGDWVSYYSALERHVDPTDIPLITKLRQALK